MNQDETAPKAFSEYHAPKCVRKSCDSYSLYVAGGGGQQDTVNGQKQGLNGTGDQQMGASR